MLKYLELPDSYAPYLFTNDGIYPYWIYDAGITIGYGHFISAADLKNDDYDKNLYDTYTPGAGFKYDPSGTHYPEIVTKSKVVPYSVIDDIFTRDVKIAEDAINDWLIDKKKTITQNEFDALIMMRHRRGSLGEVIINLVNTKASRSVWENTPDLGIGPEIRRIYQFDLYFDGTYVP